MLIEHAGALLSLGSVLASLLLAAYGLRHDRRARAARAGGPWPSSPAAGHHPPGRVCAAAALALARPLLYDAGRAPLLRPGLAAAAERGLGGLPPLNVDVAGELTLLSAGVTPDIGGDEVATVTLYWLGQPPTGRGLWLRRALGRRGRAHLERAGP